MKFQIFLLSFFFLFQLNLSEQIFQLNSFNRKTVVDFSNYINKTETELVNENVVNWVRTDYENAYVCQGQKIEKDYNLLPRQGKFMATYIYARPSFGELKTTPLVTDLFNPFNSFTSIYMTYSMDLKTELDVYLWRKSKRFENIELVWRKKQLLPTKGLIGTKIPLKNIGEEFRLVFVPHVSAEYQFTFRTYLSQIVLAYIELEFIN